MQNIVILAGNIGQKPEVRVTQSGTKITNFTLATSRPRLSEGRVMRDENGYRVMETEWHRITCFNGLGKTDKEHCETGMKILVHNGHASNSMQVFGAGVDTINGVATATGVAQAAGKSALYYAVADGDGTAVGAWFRVLSA